MIQSNFSGDWTYRSFLRNSDIDAEFNDLQFGKGTLKIQENGFGQMIGTLGGPGWSLDLKGRWSSGDPNKIRFQGSGLIGDEMWVYDYLGYLAPYWPNGVDEVPSIVGSIVRTVDHSDGKSKAGLVASWIAVKF